MTRVSFVDYEVRIRFTIEKFERQIIELNR